MRGGKGEWRGSGRGICGEFAQGSVGISRPHTNDRNGKSGKTSAAEKQERETRSEILCRELARLRARSIPVGISCSQTYGDSRNGKDRNRAEGKGNGEETGAGTAANLHREVWVLADLIRTTATAKAVKLARRKNRSAKRGAKYFAGNLRDCEQGQYPWYRLLADIWRYPQRSKDQNCAEGKGNGEEAGAGSAANLRREVWVLADLILTTVTAKAVKLARRKNRSAKRGAKYFAGNWRDCEQGQYPWVLAARRRKAIVATE